MEIYQPPEGELIQSITGVAILRLWPTVLHFEGASRTLSLIGANEDLNQPPGYYITRRVDVLHDQLLKILVIESICRDSSFCFHETSRGGPIVLRRGEAAEEVQVDTKNSAFIRYVIREVLRNKFY